MASSPKFAHLSQMLRDAIPDAGEMAGDGGLTLGDILEELRDRGQAAVLALMALPIALPVPMPGISAIFGMPMLLISMQIALRAPQVWLPDSLRRRRINIARFGPAVARLTPWLARIESVLRPRWTALFHPAAQSLYGFVCAWLSLILFLPVPFGNVLPSLSIFVLALAVLEKDGAAAIAGLVLSAVSIVVTAGATWGFLRAGAYIAMQIFGR